MAQLRQDIETLEEHNIKVLVIGPEKPAAFAKYWEKEELPFVGLPDPEHTVARLFGQEVKILKLGRMPAQMLVDMRGDLKYLHYGSSMSDIPRVGEVVEASRN